MYINRITLKDVRCFKEIYINLGDNGTSLMITGNNGSGKSAILRSIAMGLCDDFSAGALLRELEGEFVKNDDDDIDHAAIGIELLDPDDNSEYKINTKIKTHENLIYEYVEQKVFIKTKNNRWKEIKKREDFKWQNIFVVAYGAGVRTEGSESYSQYFSADSVYSLFKYTHPLQKAELSWRRLRDVAARYGGKSRIKAVNQVNKDIENLLKDILCIKDEDKITLESNGIFITSTWGKQELGSLGDGFKALVNLVLDFLSWKLLHKNFDVILDSYERKGKKEWRTLGDFRRLQGIVVIDEIEKHLHPELQRKIIRSLTEKFPKIQFVITSHSPLCVGGIADANEKTFKVYSTFDDIEGESKGIKENNVPYGLTADDIFINYFGLTSTTNTKIEEYINEYRELYLDNNKDKRSKARENELRKLLMHRYPDTYAIEKDKELKNEIKDRLNTIIQNLTK